MIINDDTLFVVNESSYILISAINIGISIPSVLNLLIDIIINYYKNPLFCFGLSANKLDSEKKNKSEITRLSILERSVFLFGVICNGFYFFFPTKWNIMAISTINNIFNGSLAVLLQIAPIIIFLERVVDVFTPILTTTIILILTFGVCCGSSALLYPPGLYYTSLNLISLICYSISTWLVISICLYCLFTNIKYNFYNNKNIEEILNINEKLNMYQIFNKYQIPALHMCILMIEMLVCFAWYFLLIGMSNSTFELLNYLYIFSAASVMTIEMRIHTNEVNHGLDIIESKRAFVRFISHEMRTPMSSVIMGLELLSLGIGMNIMGTTLVTTSEYQPILLLSGENLGESLCIIYESIRTMESIFDCLIKMDTIEDIKNNLKITDFIELVLTLLEPLKVLIKRKNIQLFNNIKYKYIPVNINIQYISDAITNILLSSINRAPVNGIIKIDIQIVDTLDTKIGKADNEFSVRIINNLVFKNNIYQNKKYVILQVFFNDKGFLVEQMKQENINIFTFNPNELYGEDNICSRLMLSVTKPIIKAHNGNIWIFSKGKNYGSTLIMGLPINYDKTTGVKLFSEEKVKENPQTLPLNSSNKHNKINLFDLRKMKNNKQIKIINTDIDDIPKQNKKILDELLTKKSNISCIDTHLEDHNSLLKQDSIKEPSNVNENSSNVNENSYKFCIEDIKNITPFENTPKQSKVPEELYFLVVEDSMVARTILVKLLKSINIECDEAINGAQAVEIIKEKISNNEKLHDIILCDSVMPIMDGPTAVKIIREYGYGNPIIGVTGNTLPEQINDFINHGANEVITKPVKINILKNTIIKYISSQKWKSENTSIRNEIL